MAAYIPTPEGGGFTPSAINRTAASSLDATYEFEKKAGILPKEFTVTAKINNLELWKEFPVVAFGSIIPIKSQINQWLVTAIISSRALLRNSLYRQGNSMRILFFLIQTRLSCF